MINFSIKWHRKGCYAFFAPEHHVETGPAASGVHLIVVVVTRDISKVAPALAKDLGPVQPRQLLHLRFHFPSAVPMFVPGVSWHIISAF
eukprot:COSAG06_NODE_4158_length_4512_cov_4.141400_1_plen_89_part_00